MYGNNTRAAYINVQVATKYIHPPILTLHRRWIAHSSDYNIPAIHSNTTVINHRNAKLIDDTLDLNEHGHNYLLDIGQIKFKF